MKPFERSCIYHATYPMRVIEEDNEAEYKRLLDSGEWFDHPNKVNAKGAIHHEKQIRQQPIQRRSNGKNASKQNGSGTQC